MELDSNPRLVSVLRLFARLISWLIIAIGAAVLAGWGYSIASLRSILPSLVPMTPATAFCFILTGASILLLVQFAHLYWAKTLAAALSSLVGLVGAATLAEYIFRINLGIDTILFPGQVAAVLHPFPGRMAPHSAFNFLLSGIALLLTDYQTCKGMRPSQMISLLVGVVALLALLGYSYGIRSFYSIGFYKPMALHTAAAFAMACAGILCIRPDCGIMAVAASSGEGGVTLRRLLLLVIACPFVLGWLQLQGYRMGWYDMSFGLSLYSVALIIIFSFVIWANALALHAIDAKRLVAEKELQQKKDFSVSLLQNSTASTFVLNSQHKVIIWNRACEELTGIRSSAVVGTDEHWKAFYGFQRPTLADIILESNFDALSKYYRLFGRSSILSDGWRAEGWFTNIGGRNRYIVLDAAPVYDSANTLIAAIETVQDITERVRAEEALIESEERYRELIQNMPVGLYRNTPGESGTFIMANQAMVRMFGFSTLADFFQVPVAELYEDPQEYARFLETLTAAGKVIAYQLRLRRYNGEVFWAGVTAKVVRNEAGQIEYFDGMVEDISERKRIDEMKNDFISMVSHQLKTPVAEIKGYLFNMLSGLTGELSAKQRQYIEEMMEISNKNYRLISDLLNISRLDRGVISVDIKPVSLRLIVDRVLTDYYDIIKRRGLVLDLEGAEKDILVAADTDKCVESIGNVINNAVKFTETGSISVRLRSEGAFGVVEVSDTGPGMSPEQLSRLFAKDQMLAGAPSPGGGAGLGLYIGRQFMRLQKGDVTASSAPGQGAKFIFTIPLAQV